MSDHVLRSESTMLSMKARENDETEAVLHFHTVVNSIEKSQIILADDCGACSESRMQRLMSELSRLRSKLDAAYQKVRIAAISKVSKSVQRKADRLTVELNNMTDQLMGLIHHESDKNCEAQTMNHATSRASSSRHCTFRSEDNKSRDSSSVGSDGHDHDNKVDLSPAKKTNEEHNRSQSNHERCSTKLSSVQTATPSKDLHDLTQRESQASYGANTSIRYCIAGATLTEEEGMNNAYEGPHGVTIKVPDDTKLEKPNSLLSKFREYYLTVIGDIEKMFHRFKVKKEHRNYIHFLWWDNGYIDKPLVSYRYTVQEEYDSCS